MSADAATPAMSLEPSGWRLAGLGAMLGLLASGALLQVGLGLPKPLTNETWWVVPLATTALMCGPRPARGAVWLLAAVATLLLAVVVFTPLTPWAYHRYVVDEGPQPADLIVVLSGSTYQQRFTWSSQERFVYGVGLWRSGFAPRILFTGDPTDPTNQFAEVAMTTLHSLGLPTDQVLVLQPPAGMRAANTRTEALSTLNTVRGLGIRRILLVTSPSHTRRAKLTFEHAGLPVTVAAVPSPSYRLGGMASRDVKLFMSRALIYEAEGLVLYRLRRWL